MPPKTIIADEATNNLNTNTEDIGKSDVKKKKTIRKINSTDTMPRQLDPNWVIHKPSITKKRKDYMKNEVDDADGGVIENAIAPGKEKSVVDNENAKPKKKRLISIMFVYQQNQLWTVISHCQHLHVVCVMLIQILHVCIQ